MTDGYKLVPLNPTQNMCFAAIRAVEKAKFSFHGSVIKYDTPELYLAKIAYVAMLDAVPEVTIKENENE